MSWDTALEALMPDTVTVSSLSGLSSDGYGTATYTTGTSYKARVVGKQELVRSFAGVEETSSAVAWIATTGVIDASSRITLSDGSTPGLLAVAAYPDEDGPNHVKVWFG